MPAETLLWDTIIPLTLIIWMTLMFIGMFTHDPGDPPEQKSGERGIRYVARSSVDFAGLMTRLPFLGLAWLLSKAMNTGKWLIQPKNGDHA